VSVLDDFRQAEQRVMRRLKELEPAVAEYRELQQIAERLGVKDGAGGQTPTRATAGRPRRRSAGASAAVKRPARTRQSAGGRPDRRAQLLGLVRERPGITVREAGAELGVDPTSLYRVVHQLEQEQAVQKRGRELVAQ
jgi:hypothetical protein